MKQQINEVRRLQQLAGILKEDIQSEIYIDKEFEDDQEEDNPDPVGRKGGVDIGSLFDSNSEDYKALKKAIENKKNDEEGFKAALKTMAGKAGIEDTDSPQWKRMEDETMRKASFIAVEYFKDWLINNSKALKEEQAIITARDITATPFKNDGPNIKIPQGSEIVILKDPYENQPNASKIKYKSDGGEYKEYSVTRSILDLAKGSKALKEASYKVSPNSKEAKNLKKGDIITSGEEVVSVSAGAKTEAGKVEVTLSKGGKTRTAVWGKSTKIGVKKPD